ncbi:T9SS type A sorting domain-containing protein [Bacteroidota bacterium]
MMSGNDYKVIGTINQSFIGLSENNSNKCIAGFWTNMKKAPISVNSEITSSKGTIRIHPNPFTGTTTISYAINIPGEVSIAITDIMGTEVAKLLSDEFMEAGQHSIEFDANELPAGVYFCTLSAGGYTETVKMVVVK